MMAVDLLEQCDKYHNALLEILRFLWTHIIDRSLYVAYNLLMNFGS